MKLTPLTLQVLRPGLKLISSVLLLRTLDSACVCVSHSVMSDSLWSRELQSTRLLLSMGFSRKNTRVGSHSLLQGSFLTLGSNTGLLYCRWILYFLSHLRSPITAMLGCKTCRLPEDATHSTPVLLCHNRAFA